MAASKHEHRTRTPRLTIPLAPESPLAHQPRHLHTLNEATRFATWEPCERCNHTGYVEQARPYCKQCGQSFSPEVLAAHLGHRWPGRRPIPLPCGCPIDTQGMVYVSAHCPDCSGVGYTEGYVTLGDVMDFMSEAYEATIEAITTARMRRAP